MCGERTNTRSAHGCKRGMSYMQSHTCGFSTAEYYRRGIELHITPRIGDIPLKKADRARPARTLQRTCREHGRLREGKGKQPGLSDSTIRGIHTMLHNALDRAVKERLIVRNPADDCIPPKIPKHEMKILPPEQIKSYLTAADQRGVLPMFYLELISGLRKGELVALQWSDLDIENKMISVSKQAGAKQRRRAGYHTPENGKLDQKKSPSRRMPLICWSQNTRNIPATHGCSHPQKQARCTIRIRWSTSTRRFLKDTGLEHLRFHDLRHTFATLALQNGVDVKTVSSMLRSFRRRFHAENLHPRHAANAGERCRKDG